jgi:hypothetical protein
LKSGGKRRKSDWIRQEPPENDETWKQYYNRKIFEFFLVIYERFENTSYSAMLNIVEPIPSDSRNSVYHFQYNSGIPGISSYQFLGIPGIPSDFGIE